MSELKLTAEQELAIHTNSGNLLVSAAAGSGKTYVLVQRLLARILESDELNIDDFLIITYTKAAAEELRLKIEDELYRRLGGNPSNRKIRRQLKRMNLASIGTIHSFCADTLRRFSYLRDVPDVFRVAEEAECAELKSEAAISSLRTFYRKASPEFKNTVDVLGAGRDDTSLAGLIISISEKADAYPDPDQALRAAADLYSVDVSSDFSDTLWGKYLLGVFQERLLEYALVLENCAKYYQDEDVLLPACRVLQADAATLRAYASIDLWQLMYERGVPDFGSSLRFRKDCDETVKYRFKELRKEIKGNVRDLYSIFHFSSADAMKELQQQGKIVNVLVGLVREYRKQWKEEKRSRGIFDFSDLEHETLRLLLKDGAPTKAAHDVAERFDAVFVDEYQDCSAIQNSIFHSITSEKNNLFMVGDVKQSIYSFRLADPSLFLQKYDSYVDAGSGEPGEGVKVSLTRNFRSDYEILAAANFIFSLAMSKESCGMPYGKNEMLYPAAMASGMEGNAVELHILDRDVSMLTTASDGNDVPDEAEFTAHRIKKLLDSGATVSEPGAVRACRPGDIAILLRSPSINGSAYVRELKKLGIPCAAESSNHSQLPPECEVMLSFLEIMDNPHRNESLTAVLMSPLYCFSAERCAEIKKCLPYGDLFEALSAETSDESNRFLSVYHALRDSFCLNGTKRGIEDLWRITDCSNLFSASPEGEYADANLTTLKGLALSYASNGLNPEEIAGVLRRKLEKEGLSSQKNEPSESVILTSIHKSKGLEYPIVILPELAKGFSRNNRSGAVLYDSDLGIATNLQGALPRAVYPSLELDACAEALSVSQNAEEMRILYVALTRARNRLVMISACKGFRKHLFLLDSFARFGTASGYSKASESFSDWVIAAALHKTESGALLTELNEPAISYQKPFPDAPTDSSWTVRVYSGPDNESHSSEKETPSEKTPDRAVQTDNIGMSPDDLLARASFRYPAYAASRLPLRLTATSMKNRLIDYELAEDFIEEGQKREAGFFKRTESGGILSPLSAAEQGTAIHAVMQYISFDRCDSPEHVRLELDRLVSEQYITALQAEAVDCSDVSDFFCSELGRRLLKASFVKREFKFSVMKNIRELPKLYGIDLKQGTLPDEAVIVQGVVDCFFQENGKMIVIDFKSDHVKPGSELAEAEKYRTQIEVYAASVAEIFDSASAECWIWFFHTGKAVRIL